MWKFLRAHPIPGIGLLAGPFCVLLGLMIDAYHLTELGFPPQILEALGAAVFFLSVIGILYKWWNENQRVPVGQRQTTQPQVADRERNQTASSRVELSPSPPEQFLVPQDIYYSHDTAAGLGYPHKLWIVLRNESRRDLVVSPASWETSTGDIAIRPVPKHPWTPEGRGGWENNSWSWPRLERESEPIHVSRGQVVQTWVGLPEPLDDTELRRRIVSKRLGTLIIPFTIDGRAISQTIKL